MLTVDELDKFLRKLWAERGHAISAGERMGIATSEIVQASAERMANLGPSVVTTWIAILDEFESWLISLLLVTYGQRRQHKNKLNDFENSITTLLSKIIGDTFAIRLLANNGFDTASQPVLRSTCEYLEVLVAIIDDPSFGTPFVKSDTPEGAKAFWETHLRGGKIRKRLRKAWAKFFQEECDSSLFFADWGHQDAPLMSGLSHPSFAGGMFTAISMKTKHTDEAWLGIWGDRSEGTSETIHTYAKFLLPLLILGRGFPFGDDWQFDPPITFDELDEAHRHVKTGRDVLASLILSLSTDNNREHIFPEYDLSIFPEG